MEKTEQTLSKACEENENKVQDFIDPVNYFCDCDTKIILRAKTNYKIKNILNECYLELLDI